jgi:4-hydroxythreonine-4-phosphate dehydrogenase
MMADAQNAQRPIVITTGEPAGIGPELIIQLLQTPRTVPLVVAGDVGLLLQRAAAIGLELTAIDGGVAGPGATARIEQVTLRTTSVPGRLDPANVEYVIETLQRATDGCLAGNYVAMVTGPVHTSVIREAGHDFMGHTEFLAERSSVETPVMMLVNDSLRVALVTIHLPIVEVPMALTADLLERVLRVIDHDLKVRFGIVRPVIGVCGLNPHAGESGHLGDEEITIIQPVLAKLQAAGLMLKGPLPADTAFTQPRIAEFDVIVAMYHDQGLPVIKQSGFGEATNITLGLPFIRTSVDHGTALELAGTGRAKADSLVMALEVAEALARGP